MEQASNQVIRVAIVISNLTHGGAERQVVELANRIDSNRVELHICTLSDVCPLAEFLIRPERLHIIQKQSKYDVTVIPRLVRYLRQHRFDVVHGFLFDAEIASWLAGTFAGTTCVLGSERNSSNNFSSFKTNVYRYASKLMDACIANSTAGMEFSHRTFHIPREKYRVIYNGVDTQRFQPAPSKLSKSQLGIPENALVIGFVGSFKRQKNHPLLLRAVAHLKGLEIPFHLLMVGSLIAEGSEPTVEYHEFVQREVDRLGLRDTVSFIEARNDIEDVFNLCHCTALPSLYEGTPNVALESMACGVPVVATQVADNHRIIPEGKVGFVTPLDDAEAMADRLKQLLTKPELREQMANNAREWVVNEFHLDTMAENFERTYRDLLDEKRGK